MRIRSMTKFDTRSSHRPQACGPANAQGYSAVLRQNTLWNRWLRLWVVTFILSIAPLAFAHGDILIKGATVLSFAGTGQAKIANILVSNERIVRVEERDIAVPKRTKTIDGHGLYLMPGLIEMHGHLPGTGHDPQFAEEMLFLFLARGVTTVRSMLGHANHMALRKRV